LYEQDSASQSRGDNYLHGDRRCGQEDSIVVPEKEVRYGMWEKHRISRFDSGSKVLQTKAAGQEKKDNGDKSDIAGSKEIYTTDKHQYIMEDMITPTQFQDNVGKKERDSPHRAGFVQTGWHEADKDEAQKQFSDDLNVKIGFRGGLGSHQVVKEEYFPIVKTVEANEIDSPVKKQEEESESFTPNKDTLEFDELQKKLQQYWKAGSGAEEKPKKNMKDEKLLPKETKDDLIKPETTYRKRKLSSGSSLSSSSSSSGSSRSASRKRSGSGRCSRSRSHSRSKRASRHRSYSRNRSCSRSRSRSNSSHSRSGFRRGRSSPHKHSGSHSRHRRSRSHEHYGHRQHSRSRSRSRQRIHHRSRANHWSDRCQEKPRGANIFSSRHSRSRSRSRSHDKGGRKFRWWSPSRSKNPRDRIYAESEKRFRAYSKEKSPPDSKDKCAINLKPTDVVQSTVQLHSEEKAKDSSLKCSEVVPKEKVPAKVKQPEKISFSIKAIPVPKAVPKSSVVGPAETRNSLVEMEKFLKNLKERKKEELNEKFKFQLKKKPDNTVW
jgi:hypothetical protein